MKAIVVVLVLVAALFVAIIVLGLGRPEGGPRTAAASNLVDDLRGLLIGPADDVRPDELSDACRAGRTFHVLAGFPCLVGIRPSEAPVRQLQIAIVSGTASVSLKEHVPKGPGSDGDGMMEIPPTDLSPDADDDVSFSVFDDGGELEIRCQPGTDCVLTLVTGDAA